MANHIVRTRGELTEVYKRLKQRKHIALDTEYDAQPAEWAVRMREDLDNEHGKKKSKKVKITDNSLLNLVGMSLADKDDAWYVPCSLVGVETARKCAQGLMAVEGLTIWAHNWRAEWNSLKPDLDAVKARLGDTMIAAWCCEAGEPYYQGGKLKYRYGLKPVVKHLFGIAMKDYTDVVGGQVLAHGPTNEDIEALYVEELAELHRRCLPKPPTKKALNEVRKAYNARRKLQVWRERVASDCTPEEIADYACADASMTLQLARYLAKRLKEVGYHDQFWSVEMKVARIVHEMEHEGVPVDVAYFERCRDELRKQVKELEDKWYSLTSTSIRSASQCAKAVFEDLKCWEPGPLSYTKKGQLSVNKQSIGYALATCPEGSLGRELAILKKEHSKLYKLANTYMNAFIYQGKYNGGRMRCDIVQTGTNTGRFAMKNPNLQSTPKEMIREGLVAPDGWVFVDADWASLEIVVMGHFSKDARIAEIVLTGKSQHDITAEGLGIKRQDAKTVNFLLNYGGGAKRLSANLMIPWVEVTRRDGHKYFVAPPQVTRMVEKYYETYSGVSEFREHIAEECRYTGYVSTILGRRRYLPAIHSRDKLARYEAERMASNTPIQGSAADIAKLAMIKLWELWRARKSSARMLLQVHDEILVMCREDEAQQVADEMKEVMANPGVKLILPLRAEVGIGRSWAGAK